MRLYVSIVKALLAPPPKGQDILAINRRGRSVWRRAIVITASPIANPSVLVQVASKLRGVLHQGAPHPMIESMKMVFEEWCKWAAATQKVFDDYTQTDVARVMKDSCIEEFYRKYGINKSISPTHLIQGRMRGVIRRQISKNPFQNEEKAAMRVFLNNKPGTPHMACFAHAAFQDPVDLVLAVVNMMQRHRIDQFENIERAMAYLTRYGGKLMLSSRGAKLVELLHLWYSTAKSFPEYVRILNTMQLYKPEVPPLAPL